MIAKVFLFSSNHENINTFLNKFYNSSSLKNFNISNSAWSKNFNNPLDISELAAAYADNFHSNNLNMWISLDFGLFIKVSPSNVNDIIKYLFHFLVLYKSGGKLSDGFPAANKGVLDKEVNLFTKRQKIM